MRPFNKKFSVFDPNLQIGADTKKTADGDNNIQKAEFEQVIRSSGQTPGASISITSLTQTAGLATAVTAAPHGFINGQWVDIFGVDAVPYELLVYNGIQQATVTAPDTFTFPILPGTPSPATGTIGAYHSQIDKAIANYTASQFSWKEAAGSIADFYVLERVGIPDLTAPSAYNEGALFQFEIVNTNTGGVATVEIPTLGVKAIITQSGTSPRPGWLLAGRVATLRYDGANLVLLEPGVIFDVDGPTDLTYTSTSTFGWAYAGFNLSVTSTTGLLMVIMNMPNVAATNVTNASIGIQQGGTVAAPLPGTEITYGSGNITMRGQSVPLLYEITPGAPQAFSIVANVDALSGTITFQQLKLTAWAIGA